MKGILRKGAAALTALGVVGGAVTTISTVVEQINYEYVSEITTSYVYRINGEDVSQEEYLELKESLNAITTEVEDRRIEVINNDDSIIFYGAVDSLDALDVDMLTAVDLDQMVASYTCNISTGSLDDETEQHQVFIIPDAYIVTSITTGGLPFNLLAPDTDGGFVEYLMDGYRVYYFEEPSHDIDYGGYNYLFTISVAK